MSVEDSEHVSLAEKNLAMKIMRNLESVVTLLLQGLS